MKYLRAFSTRLLYLPCPTKTGQRNKLGSQCTYVHIIPVLGDISNWNFLQFENGSLCGMISSIVIGLKIKQTIFIKILICGVRILDYCISSPVSLSGSIATMVHFFAPFFWMPPHQWVNGGLGGPPGVTIPGTTCSHPGQ